MYRFIKSHIFSSLSSFFLMIHTCKLYFSTEYSRCQHLYQYIMLQCTCTCHPQKDPPASLLYWKHWISENTVKLVIDIQPLHRASFLFGCQRDLLSVSPQLLKTNLPPTLEPRSDMADLGVNPLHPTLQPLLQAMGLGVHFSMTSAL